jgi:ketosteroid isomerase-like protein
MEMRAAARRWAEVWERSWTALDVEPIVALYDEEATFSSEPFRPLRRGRDGVRAYVETAFAAEEAVEARFAEPLCDGEAAAVAWWAALRDEGEEITLSGVSILRFAADGRCRSQRDHWNQAPGRRPPPQWG